MGTREDIVQYQWTMSIRKMGDEATTDVMGDEATTDANMGHVARRQILSLCL